MRRAILCLIGAASMAAIRRLTLVFLLAGLGLHGAFAGEAAPLADDPVLEARVTRLAEELRCLVCQNQTIADSHAGLAVDLKNQIREQLRAGRDDAQVLDYMVERYGDFVLYRPPVKTTTAALWYGPFVLLVLGIAAGVVAVRRHRPRGADPAASPAQRARAAAWLADESNEARP
jgi:cytochrome c-type biogenesis protein CcmH